MDVEIEEVGLREGVQSNKKILSLEEKIYIVKKLLNAGINRIQLGSFVNPKLVPQMEGVEELFKYFGNIDNIKFSGLVLNIKGVERALGCGVKFLEMSLSASNTHQIENTGKTIDESIKEISTMIHIAKKNNAYIRANISASFGCAFEGIIKIETVKNLVKMLIKKDVNEIALSDTVGFATPGKVAEMLDAVSTISPNTPFALHMHDALGMGLANIIVALEKGIRSFDSSVVGLGGCPFMKNAPGNVATEDVVYMLQSLGYLKQINIQKLCDCALYTRELYKKTFTGKISQYKDALSKLNLLDSLDE